jgi:hypothetical protein
MREGRLSESAERHIVEVSAVRRRRSAVVVADQLERVRSARPDRHTGSPPAALGHAGSFQIMVRFRGALRSMVIAAQALDLRSAQRPNHQTVKR